MTAGQREHRLAELPSGSALTAEFVFRLYVSGATPASARAVVNARRLCEAHLKGRYQLEILDLADHVAAAAADQVIVTPTLVRVSPLPLRRYIGDLSNSSRIVDALGVRPAGYL